MAFYGAMKVEYDWTIALNEWADGGTAPSFKELEGPNVTSGTFLFPELFHGILRQTKVSFV